MNKVEYITGSQSFLYNMQYFIIESIPSTQQYPKEGPWNLINSRKLRKLNVQLEVQTGYVKPIRGSNRIN